MTHRSSAVDIIATLLEHGTPMTRAGLTREIGIRQTSIDRALNDLLKRELVAKVGEYVNPGTKRRSATFAPGPKVVKWFVR